MRDIVDVVSASQNRPDNQGRGYNKVVIRSYDFTGTTFFPTSRCVAAFFVLIFTDRVSGGNLVTRHFGFCSMPMSPISCYNSISGCISLNH
jgi:hypothetical protein